MDNDEQPPRRRGFKEHMSLAASALLRAAASAGELLSDPSLRRRGAALIMDEASKGIQDIQRGLEEGANTVAELGVKRVQSVLKGIERKVSEFQRSQQPRGDSPVGYEFLRRNPMDIQMGAQVYEDMPSEMRSRLYYVLSTREDLAEALKQQSLAAGEEGPSRPRHIKRPSRVQDTEAAAAAASSGQGEPGAQQQQQRQQRQQEDQGPGEREAPSPAGERDARAVQQQEEPGSAAAGGPQAAAAEQQQQQQQQEEEEEEQKAGHADVAGPASEGGDTGAGPGAAAAGGADASAADEAGSAAATGPEDVTAADADSSSGAGSERGAAAAPAAGLAPVLPLLVLDFPITPVAPNPWNSTSSPAFGPAAPAGTRRAGSGAAGVPSHPIPAPLATRSQSQGSDEWEVLTRSAVGGAVGDSGAVEAVETVRTLAQSLMEGAGPMDQARASQAALFEAMLEVPWQEGVGIPDGVDQSGTYARLVSTPPGDIVQRCMGGVEPVVDVISRDLARTFPEHPLFVAGDGQAKLGRVLRAYALHDEEVGYCQGQAFAAGMLLMYVPEETAFKLYCRLMDEPPRGAGLRRLYQPGLEPLKLELSRFELLLASHLPALHAHLQAAGLPAVLYASQWFMTQFCSPFPLHLGGRVLDVLLQSGDDGALPRVGLALMEALQAELLALDDFEAIITAVKVTPLQWPVHAYRRVLDRALSQDFVSAAELRAARAAAAAEAARLGRPSSFSARRLVRAATGGERVELSPLAEAPAEGSDGGGAAPSEPGAPAPPAPAALAGAASAGAGSGVGAAPAGSLASLVELDLLEFEAVLHDLHLILPGSASEDEDGRGGAREAGDAASAGAGAGA